MSSSANHAMRKSLGKEVTPVLIHLKKLLRVRNLLCSPLLQLPTETIIRILSFIMADLDSYFSFPVWTSIYGTCHQIYEIMRSATELWWKVDCARDRVARFAFVRSRGNPQVIVSDLGPASDNQVAKSERLLDHLRDKWEFRGHRLHTLEFSGTPSSFTHFSWILERPLPRLERLKLNFLGSLDEDEIEVVMPNPVELQLPADMSLQVLNLRNAVLPWSSQDFTRLRDLQLDFRDCDPSVTIPEDELFGIFDASPQLERLSLVHVGHDIKLKDGEPVPPKRILQFPNLTFLKLDNGPEVVKYTLAYMDLPVIASLEIRSYVSQGMTWSINRLFPDNRLMTRLFPSPPVFSVRTSGDFDASVEVNIGSIGLRFDFPLWDGEFGRRFVMSNIPELVPPSVTTLKLDYTQLDKWSWRGFFASHPEVRSIECPEFWGIPVSNSLWEALSPDEEGDGGVPCPKLESILITSYTRDVLFTHLSDCLRSRQAAGFKLRRLKIMDFHRAMTRGYAEDFGPLVEVVEADEPRSSEQRWGQGQRMFSMIEECAI